MCSDVVAQIGLGFDIVGVVILAWVSYRLLEATTQFNGIQEKDRQAVRLPGRVGWGLVLLGLAGQSVALWC